ncbi:GPI transamidase component [Cladophialophora chaetospira]|uniref:GPI transamidase component n=1 Tax=Cladophialophora chaetospira TaxID=386627 RepID=A0AA38X1N9_9EURO|nr:GPI transamidase component [Cladophialophora chaetospira]
MDEPSTASLNAAPVTKQPPPEKTTAVNLRTKIVLSFWAVILLLGIPTWLRTTSIYRANLPLQDMLDWADGLNTPTAIPLHIWVSAPDLPCSEAQAIVRDTQQALDDLNEFPTLHQRLHLVNIQKDGGGGGRESCGELPTSLNIGEPALKLSLERTSDGFAFGLKAVSAEARARIPSSAGVSVAKSLAEDLYGLFKEEQIAATLQTVSLTSHTQNAQAFLKSQPYDIVAGVEKQINRAYKSSPEFHLTFSLLTASGAPSSWDIQSAITEHVQPLVKALSSIADFEVTTQVQLYATLPPTVQPSHREGLNGTFLYQSDLPAFVNAAEWPLAPSLGDGPTLNFILYVPAKDQVPLTIEGINEHSWLIPQWGGIQILNPPLHPHPVHGTRTLPPQLDKELLHSPFQTFASQLLSLLGVLQSSDNTKARPLQLRLDAYKRLSTLTLYLKAASSLGSLARLAQRLSNIPIPRDVAQLVDDAISNLCSSRHALLESKWDEALSYAKVAFRDSEKAFFDKSMVGQVYFPDEHKVAVYLPLLGPVGVPLVIGLLREVKRFISSKRAA